MDAATAAPYVASGVALAVGLVNPWVTNRLTDGRQRDQLDHDRAMRRREEILALIADATTRGSRRFYLTDRAKDAWQRALAWDDPHTREIERERVAVVEELRDAWGRIHIRFSPGSPVQERFDHWRATLDAYSHTVRFCHEAGRPFAPEIVQVDELRQAAAEAAERWLDAARAAVADLDALDVAADS